MSLSNPDAKTKIDAVQNEIKQGLADFAAGNEAADMDRAKLIYQSVGAKILNLRVLISRTSCPRLSMS